MHPTFNEIHQLLINLLDSPVIDVIHVGSTVFNETGVLDVLVIVPSLHAMTTLDEKRLNQAGFYRLHHPYHKKCVFSQFNSLTSLDEKCRLLIVEENSKKAALYLESQHMLEQSRELRNQFKDYKTGISHLIKKDYESAKSDWFRMNIANKR
ncbi:GrpB family protein [Macrococcus hajekii]|uniref:GrpB family protein n=1 Tax=Macrococcus hajekii TaxID=198482 RepID=A0A4R6BIR9_9STAP|nr:GrpB family protein [Macrococcus hajekii]TDM01487.1 GrpB family protein [Macrococcus hajekii]GGB00352.1 hypothetical protein GCM10007190_05560 [Macrococcus hajekii]